MKKLILVFIITLIKFNFIYSQPVIQWQKSLGGTYFESANSIIQTADGGYISAGHSYSSDGNATLNHGLGDCWIVRMDSIGSIQWQNSFGGSAEEETNCILQTHDGGFIFAGNSSSSNGDVTGNHGSFDFWIVKLAGTGSLQWEKSLGGSDEDNAKCIQQTSDGGYIVSGSSASNDGDVTGHDSLTDCWIVKLDSAGSILWQKTLGGKLNDVSNSIQQTFDGGYIVAGTSESDDGDLTGNHGMRDMWIVKLDNLGSIQWQENFGGSENEFANSILQSSDSGYVIAGSTHSNDGDVSGNHGSDDCWVIKINSTGVLQWTNLFGGLDHDGANSINATSDGGYIVSGYSGSPDLAGYHGQGDYIVTKLNDQGIIEWQKLFGGTGNEESTCIHQTSDGGFIAAGYSNSNDGDVSGNHGSIDSWILKLGSLVSVNEIQNSISDFVISPNPISSNTVISFNQNSSGRLKIIIRDIEGRIIKNLDLSNTNGINQIMWDVTNDSGSRVVDAIYYLSILSDESILTRKIVVLRN